MSGHNIKDVDSLQNLIVMTWPHPHDVRIETFVRIETLPPELQVQIREHVRGAIISEQASVSSEPAGI